MKLEEEQLLIRVSQTIGQKYSRLETIRQLVETEEQYRRIIREVDRVNAQLMRARTARVAATLTVVDWFIILERFDWKCAYCRVKPFQVMNHRIPQVQGGTTPKNCLPACYSCRAKQSTGTRFWVEPAFMRQSEKASV